MLTDANITACVRVLHVQREVKFPDLVLLLLRLLLRVLVLQVRFVLEQLAQAAELE